MGEVGVDIFWRRGILGFFCKGEKGGWEREESEERVWVLLV